MLKKIFCWLLLCQPVTVLAQLTIAGKVIDEEQGVPLSGAMVTIPGTTVATSTDDDGSFHLRLPENTHSLQISLIGYGTETVILNGTNDQIIEVALQRDVEELKPVTVSTGYLDLPKERATGSFTTIDQELFNRNPGSNLLDRLEGMAEGLYFDKRQGGAPELSVRGRGTILSDNRPLIVVDNFPYEGELDAINPNDIEQITILKDAAAASIWGARAGNGVIVITTKKGSESTVPRISFTSNVAFNTPPDIYYNPHFLSSDSFVELEKRLFAEDFFDAGENAANQAPLSPVVELLIRQRDGLISPEDAGKQLEMLKARDIRREFERHVYQAGIDQQYALSVNGGTDAFNYFISGGYDHSQATKVGITQDRITLRSNANSRLARKLWLGVDVNYTRSGRRSGYDLAGELTTLRPYTQLADEAGNPLPVYADYRKQYVEDAESNGLLNWRYYPLQEMEQINYETRDQAFRVNSSLQYHLTESLSAELRYQYEQGFMDITQDYSPESYYSRNLINQFTQPDGTRAVPEGGVLNQSHDELRSNSVRAQLNFRRQWGEMHEVAALAGAEARQARRVSNSTREYGYQSDVLTTVPVDYTTRFALRPTRSGYIPGALRGPSLFTDRFVSAYINSSYTYRRRYILSVSARRDASNLFGVNTNQKGVPLWSVGLAWIGSEESFIKLPWLSFLKLRGSYGYSGNIDKTVTAYATAGYSTNRLTGLQQARIQSPPNPDLRWEKVRTINAGIDFEIRGSRFSGSLEYYHKKGTDQMGDVEIDPTAGFFQVNNYRVNLNSASFEASGIDIHLHSRNLRGMISWETQLMMSYNTDHVTDYHYRNTSLSSYFQSNPAPVEEKPRMAVYSFRWAGLDPETGDPMIIADGEPSKDYSTIYTESDVEDLYYHGRSLPAWYGTLLNRFSWKNISLSANLGFKWGYYFRRSSISYYSLVNQWISHRDYKLRWQRPGDEKLTSVPSMPEEQDSRRDLVYNNSAILVEKGDHLRLKDVRLDYRFKFLGLSGRSPVNMTLFLFWDNPGIIWRANTAHLDPDFSAAPYPEPQSIMVGLKMNL